MAESHVLAALIQKRAELAGEIGQAEEALSVLHQKLKHVDGALAVFGYEHAPQIVPIRRQGPGLFGGKKLMPMILDILRRQGPLTTSQVRHRLIAENGLDGSQPHVRERAYSKAHRALHRLYGQGHISFDGEVWAISGRK